MSSKEQYRLLCLSESSIPIYSRDWWLDIVCGEKHWDVLLATQKEAIVAALPIYTPCPGIISMPFFTQTMGPWFAPDADTLSYRRQLTKRQEILKTFIEELKHIPTFLQNFHPDITDWLPFYWAGYEQTTRYTYILDDISDSTHLWQQMSANIRRNITRAEQRYRIVVRRNVPVEDFLRSLREKGRTILLSTHIFSLVEKLCDRVGVLLEGRLAKEGTLEEIRSGKSLEESFFDLLGEGRES